MAVERINYQLVCEECHRDIPLLQTYYEVAYMVCYCKSCYEKKYGKQNNVTKIEEKDTIKCARFNDITECNYSHPCDECSFKI